jgi:hypothetical protein
VVALNGGFQGNGSLVSRVRKLLFDFDEMTKTSGELESPPGICEPSPWLGESLVCRSAGADLVEVERRLEALKKVLPEFHGVETGPLVPQARSYFVGGPSEPSKRESTQRAFMVSQGIAE